MAEYGSLRTEVLQLSQQMANLFALQVGAAGSILSVALGAADKRYVALVLPVVGFLIATRYFYLFEGILHIARYIREVLSSRVPGGLGWEQWLQTSVRTPGRRIRQSLANWITFVAVPLLAWALATPDAVAGKGSVGLRLLRLGAWVVSFAFTVMTYSVVRRSRSLSN